MPDHLTAKPESRGPTVRSLEAWNCDVMQLVAIEEAAFIASDHYDDQPWDATNFEIQLPGKDELSLVAVSSGEPIAFLIASTIHGDPHIHRLAVLPSCARRGIGTHLLATFLDRAGASVSVSCDARNSEALSLYLSAGFSQAGINPDGKVLLRAEAPSQINAWYVFTATNMRSGHAAHVPRLLDTMRERGLSIDGLRYGTDGDIPTFTPTLDWWRHFRELTRRAMDSEISVIFVRIQWKLALILSLWSRLKSGRPTVTLWSSGGPGVLPETRLGWRLGASRKLHQWAMSRAIPSIVTGPPRLLEEYSHRYRIPKTRLLLACNDIDVGRWRDVAQTKALPTPVDSWANATGPKYLYVHGIDRIRGADRLPEIFARLRELEPTGTLLVVGDGPLELDFANDGVHMVGRLPNADLPPIIASADCLLVPSRQEGFPRVLLESMALGVPPVTFDVGGCRDVLGPGLQSLVVPDGAIDHFVRAAHEAVLTFGNSDAQRVLVQRAEAFDTSVVGDRLATVLRVLGTRGSASAAWFSRALWVDTFPRPIDGVADDAQPHVHTIALRGSSPG